MDEREELMQDMWQNWKPYNRATDDRWRSYIVNSMEQGVLEAESNCVTICNGTNGMYSM